MIFSILIWASTFLFASPQDAQPEFWAGVAVVDLTPDRNVPLGGYSARAGKPMTGVHDKIYAKALWLETSEAKVCLVTTDLIGSLLDIRDKIKPEDASVILTAAHNHSGPGGLGKGIWELAMGKFDQTLYDELIAKLKKAVTDARAAKRPARLVTVRGEAPTLQRNRRSKNGPLDPEVNVLFVTDEEGKPLAVLTNYAAHGTVLPEKNFELSGDWPGAFQRSLEKKIPAAALFTNGAEGDMSARAPGGSNPFEKCDAIGEALAKCVDDLVKGAPKPNRAVKLKYAERKVEIPRPTMPNSPTPSVLGMLEVNGTRMFCFPGEPCVELGLELKKRYPGSWVLGLANDHLGYFLTEEEYKKGGYERMVSFYGPKMGPWLIEQFAEMAEGK